MRILFVDDEKIIRDGIRELICWDEIGCTDFLQASSTKEAIELINQSTPDLIITDICMQGMTGIELVQYCKKNNPEIKTVILSGHENFSYARQAIEAGVLKYLLKPVLPEELKEAILEAKNEIFKHQISTHKEVESEKIVSMYQPAMARQFWKELVSGGLHKEQVEKQAAIAGVILPSGPIMCICVARLDSQNNSKFDQLLYYLTQNAFRKSVSNLFVDSTLLDDGKVMAILLARDNLDLLEVQEYIKGRLGESICLSIGEKVAIDQIAESARQAQELIGVGSVIQKQALQGSEAMEHMEQSKLLVQQAKTIIQQEFRNEDFCVNDIVKKLHVSPGYFSKIFRKHTGRTCIDYIKIMRIDEAKQLLCNSKMKQSAIAQAVGYSNEHYFSLKFKGVTGESPGSYRKQRGEKKIYVENN